jgi:hypothetical protein
MIHCIKNISILIALLGCWAYAHAEPNSTANAPAKTTVSNKDKDEDVKKTVLGIMSYTRWVPPPTPVNFCIVAAKHATALEQLDSNAPHSAISISTPNGPAMAENRIVISKLDYDAIKLSAQCDVIYFGNVSPADQQKVIATRQNRPILTISEDNDCEIGSSFCLQTTSSPITFLVNLDSLTRSGVRVDPNVLLLGKKRTSP